MKRTKKFFCVLLSVLLVLSTFSGMQIQAATDDTRYSKKYLQNGGFEGNADKYNFSSNYTQPVKTDVPYWDTTAYNTTGANGKMEFFKNNAAHFNQSSTANKTVAEGAVAAELNADEVSTIYQRIQTVSGSTYTWGLDHRGRDTTDTMVLFIGPEQYKADGTTAIDPSKPNKKGQDQFVKMTDWLKTQYGVNYPDEGCSQKYTIYSKPFAENGAFRNESPNADENFSMTKTDVCNQEWNLWVISSSKENKDTDEDPDITKAIKGWSKYGTNCYNENDDSYNDVIKGAGSKLGYDCTYTVPKGQTKTLFAFTSYSGGRTSGQGIIYDATYGNLLDDINFKLYQPVSSSITEGGNGGVHTENATITSDIQNGNLFYSTVTDGELCTIRTMKLDESDTYEFQGAYVTVYKDDGTPVTRYIPIYKGDIKGLTKEEMLALSKDYFLPDGTTTTEADGTEKTWDYYFKVSVESPVHIHMMYSKAPYVLYDSNGGEPYRWVLGNLAGGNLIGFRDNFQIVEGEDGTESYYQNCLVNENTTGDLEVEQVGFYKSHDAVPNKNWNKNTFADGSTVGARFLGWAIKNSSNELVILNGKHKVTYNPTANKLGYVTFNNLDENGQIIESGAVAGLELDATHGVTLTAQWQFGYTAQAQTLLGHAFEGQQSWENSDVGGWVEETYINNRNNVTDYQDDYVAGRTERTDAYGSVGEKIIFRATPDSAKNYVFDGWYTKEADGTYKLVTTTPNLAVTVEEGKSTTYYARFKTKTVPVIFHYSASGSKDDYVYYDKDDDNKYGKYFQEVIYDETAIKPTGDSKSVTKWYTSKTDRSDEYIFDFSTPITEVTHLYASPSFNFNYFNHLTIKGDADPINPTSFSMRTFATLKIGDNYVDLKNDAGASDYNIYLLEGALGDEKPTASAVKTTKTKYKKGSSSVIFNSNTNTGKRFNRAGVKYDYVVQTAGNPLWVVFDFTYKGIKYTTPVINRSMYNQITNYHEERKSGYYTSYPAQTADGIAQKHFDFLKSIQDLIEPQASSNVAATPTVYADFAEVEGLTVDEASTSNNYTFTSTTAVRNIEPWGFKYTFSVNEKDITDFDDYGCVVLTDSNSKYDNGITVSQLLNDSKAVMYSYDCENVYLSDDEKSIEAYYVNNVGLDDFDKNTYVVFFVKDDTGYHYSNIVSNTYNDVLESDVDNEIAPLLMNYYQSFSSYTTALSDAADKYGAV